jgi:hypothetical protein
MKSLTVLALGGLTWALAVSPPAWAHCDTLDGPVVLAARKALDTANLKPALVWVKPAGEKEIREVFEKALAVRKAGGPARELADMYFFETLVRVHRAGEGACYSGLKPAGHVEPPVAAADQALASGKLDKVSKLVSSHIEEGLQKQFKQVLAKKNYDPNNVEAGRAFASAYVDYVHYVERLYNAAETLAPEAAEGQRH